MGGSKKALVFLAVTGVCVAALPWLSWITAFSRGPGLSRAVVVSHRGNGFGFPENTVEAVNAAARNGFRSEIDVRLTADKRAVVFHDATIDTPPCRGLISELSSAQLASCGLPFLENFSNFTNRHLVGLMVHVKGQSSDLINLVFAHVGPGDVVFIDSGNAPKGYLQAVRDASAASPGARITYCAHGVEDVDAVKPYLRWGDGFSLSTAHLWRDELFRKAFRASHGVVTSFGGGHGISDRVAAEGIPLALYETDFPNEVVTGSIATPPSQLPYVLFAFPIIITALVLVLTSWCLSEPPASPRYLLLDELAY